VTFQIPNVSPEVFADAVYYFDSFGVTIIAHQYTGNGRYLSNCSGRFESIAGSGRFNYLNNTLIIEVQNNAGHFSEAMIRGGLRQVIEELKERLARTHEHSPETIVEKSANERAGL